MDGRVLQRNHLWAKITRLFGYLLQLLLKTGFVSGTAVAVPALTWLAVSSGCRGNGGQTVTQAFHKTMIDAKKHLDKSLLPSEYNGTNDSMELSEAYHKKVFAAQAELALLDQMEIDVTKYSAMWNQNHVTSAAGGCGKASEIDSGMALLVLLENQRCIGTARVLLGFV
ncbi:conserved hypothetical protein [Culex quinquefasciatus]|uniref:Uncharacterized protein n=1 Tax=Culex quinquefasciatus TaxID=7176 RepID=B0XFC3_CULQU|nr:conserved hypothetical protein [Culex quinquefasciatus]|eukprot:XP_001868345.1 conserved hypothetical protein [Culex quinquefasciatus]